MVFNFIPRKVIKTGLNFLKILEIYKQIINFLTIIISSNCDTKFWINTYESKKCLYYTTFRQ